jgi:DNA-binding NarL/FixJ family response regulator
MPEPRFLVVEDDPALRRALSRIIRRYGEAVGVATVREGQALASDGSRWSGLFIDLGLPDGSGLDVLAWARAAHNRAPAMVLTGWADPDAINAAFDMHAHYVVKPFSTERIKRFLANATSVASRIEPAFRSWVARYELSEAEADVLWQSALGAGKAAIASARHTSELTVKKQVMTLLRRTGDGSLHAAVERLLRELTPP